MLHKYRWLKNPTIWLDERQNWPHSTKSGSFRCCLPLITYSMQNNQGLTWFFPKILMIKESRYLIGQEAQLAAPNQELFSDATFPWWLIPCKKVIHKLIFSQDIVDQRILQSDWTRGTTGYTQPNSSVSHHALPQSLILCKKTKTYWWSKNPAIWLDERHIWPHPIKKGSLKS